MRTPHSSLRLATAAVIVGIGLLAIASGTRAQGPLLTRAPYLQLGTPTSIVVRWRTGAATDSVVRYGSVPGQLTARVSLPSAATEHVVTLAQLTPHTRYFYSVGSSGATLAGGDLEHTFTTAPPVGARAPVRLWVLGDAGTADATARAVRDAYYAREPSSGTQLVLMLGDNAYPSGTDAEYQTAVFDTFGAIVRRSVVWPTFGNHDAISADSATQSGPYFDGFTLPTAGEAGGAPSGTEAYYAFDYANIHLVCLDSSESDRSPNGPMATWLRADLAAARAEWTIAFFHHAPYSKGTHDSDTEPAMSEMRQNFLPILEAGGVDLVLAGHSHNYERSAFIRGHYGAASTFGSANVVDGGDGAVVGYQKTRGVPDGAVYATTGSAGQAGPGSLNHPAMRVSYATSGSMSIDIDGPRLQALYLRDTAVTHDNFTMTKVDSGGLPAAPWGVNVQGSGDPNVLRWRSAAGGGRVEGYRLEAGSSPGGADIGTVTLGAVQAFAFPRVEGRYFVRVRAFNAAGLGPASEELPIVVGGWSRDVQPPAPLAPMDAAVIGSSVQLLWRRGLSEVDADQLEVGSRTGASDLGSFIVPTTSGTFAANGVPAGVYFVRYRKVNLAGIGPPSPETLIVVGGVPAPPGEPGAPRLAVTGRTVSITWAPPTDATVVVRYLLEVGTTPGAVNVVLPTPDARPGLVLMGAPPGIYYLRVRGENSVGLGLASGETRVVVP